jgi:hypothetical protein
LTADDHKRYLRPLLYSARFFYGWETGAIGSNDERCGALLALRKSFIINK